MVLLPGWNGSTFFLALGNIEITLLQFKVDWEPACGCLPPKAEQR
jgi:hypothetical protein